MPRNEESYQQPCVQTFFQALDRPGGSDALATNDATRTASDSADSAGIGQLWPTCRRIGPKQKRDEAVSKISAAIAVQLFCWPHMGAHMEQQQQTCRVPELTKCCAWQ